THAFQACALSRSAISPAVIGIGPSCRVALSDACGTYHQFSCAQEENGMLMLRHARYGVAGY
ncbi:MAG: hypothetical protein ABF504_00710, partial [Komagataeibacter saccharivorans]|uniref:hypothetical protein n=1 Tax=Komagataeibacter saccharivorans TaxID=265959 RepID=UPI0039ED06AC